MNKLTFWDDIIGEKIEIDGTSYIIIDFSESESVQSEVLAGDLRVYLDKFHMDTILTRIFSQDYPQYGVSKYARPGALIVKKVAK